MQLTIEVITPGVAENWLKSNLAIQRRIRRTNVRTYANDMRRGEWKLNGAPIVFDREGNMINGQHRLLACVEAGVPFTTVVARDADPSVVHTIDIEGVRTMSNILQVAGLTNRTALASAARLLLTYEKYVNGEGVWNSSNQVSKTELYDFIQHRLDELTYASEQVGGDKVLRTLLTQGWSTFLYTIMARKDPMLAEVFFKTLSDGEGLRQGDPVHTLRQKLVGFGSMGRKSDNIDTILAYVIKTWNRLREGEEARNLRFGDNESFPIAK